MNGAIKEGVEFIQGKDRKNGANLRAIAWNLFLHPLDQDLMLKAVAPKEYKRRKDNYNKNYNIRYQCKHVDCGHIWVGKKQKKSLIKCPLSCVSTFTVFHVSMPTFIYGITASNEYLSIALHVGQRLLP